MCMHIGSRGKYTSIIRHHTYTDNSNINIGIIKAVFVEGMAFRLNLIGRFAHTNTALNISICIHTGVPLRSPLLLPRQPRCAPLGAFAIAQGGRMHTYWQPS